MPCGFSSPTVRAQYECFPSIHFPLETDKATQLFLPLLGQQSGACSDEVDRVNVPIVTMYTSSRTAWLHPGFSSESYRTASGAEARDAPRCRCAGPGASATVTQEAQKLGRPIRDLKSLETAFSLIHYPSNVRREMFFGKDDK